MRPIDPAWPRSLEEDVELYIPSWNINNYYSLYLNLREFTNWIIQERDREIKKPMDTDGILSAEITNNLCTNHPINLNKKKRRSGNIKLLGCGNLFRTLQNYDQGSSFNKNKGEQHILFEKLRYRPSFLERSGTLLYLKQNLQARMIDQYRTEIIIDSMRQKRADCMPYPFRDNKQNKEQSLQMEQKNEKWALKEQQNTLKLKTYQ